MPSLLRFGTAFFYTVGKEEAYGLQLSGAAAVTDGDPILVTIGNKQDYAYDNDQDHYRVKLKGHRSYPDLNDNVICNFTGAAAHVIGDADGNAIVGTGLNDVLEGNDGNDFLVGRGGDDNLAGGANNDKLSDESGTNMLDGGTGYDQIIFSGNSSTYQISIDGGAATVSTAGFTDQITNAEALVFADKTVDLYDLTTGLTLTTHRSTLFVQGRSAEGAHHGPVELDYNQFSGANSFDLTDNGLIGIHVTLAVVPNSTHTIDASGLHGTGLEYSAYGGIVIGSAQADHLSGSDGAVIHGNGGDDILYAYSSTCVTLDGGNGNDHLLSDSEDSDDVLIGGAGDDLLDGSNGIDTARYSGNLSDYAVSVHNGMLTIEDARAGSPDGTDTVGNVEDFIFADGEYSVREVVNHVSGVGSVVFTRIDAAAFHPDHEGSSLPTADGLATNPDGLHTLEHHALPIA